MWVAFVVGSLLALRGVFPGYLLWLFSPHKSQHFEIPFGLETVDEAPHCGYTKWCNFLFSYVNIYTCLLSEDKS